MATQKEDKTKIVMTNGSLMRVKNIAECRMFQDQLSLNAGQKNAECANFHSATNCLTVFVLSIFEWPLKSGFTVSVLASL